MTTAQAYMMTPKETASADARQEGRDATQKTQGAAEVYQTLSDMKQHEAELWRQLEAAEAAMRASQEGMKWLKLRRQWIRASEKLEAEESIGKSRSTACDQQADRLRQLVAAGARPTVNEAY